MATHKTRLSMDRQSSKEAIFKKIQICSTVYDYYDEQKDAKAKAERLEALQELRDSLNDNKSVTLHLIPNIELVFEMIRKNIFRPLIPIKKSGDKLGLSETGIEDEDLSVDPAWPHLQGIYEIFLKIVMHDLIDSKVLKNFITPGFVHDFFALFNTEESRERDYLKTIAHRLYSRLVPRRKIFRRAMTDVFLSIIHENKKCNGANEILELLSSMISGFSFPLREEHLNFFKNVIVPLHKVYYSTVFHEQLLRCSMLYLSKDESLAILLLKGILRYWPFGNSSKESLFLSEINEIIEYCDVYHIQNLVKPIFKRLVKCISGPHLQVSDKAMLFFESEGFNNLTKIYKADIFPIIVPVVAELSETHWHKTLLESFIALKSILMDIDPILFEKSASAKGNKLSNSLSCMHHIPERALSESKWDELVSKAKVTEPGFINPSIPYTDTHVVGLNNLNGIKLSSDNLILQV